jgi:RNA polymerase sigma-70 factor, ECF subfamily
VFKIACLVLGNHADAEDATQEVFVRILRSTRRLPEVRDIKAWTARIAWQVAQERSKRRHGREFVEASIEEIPRGIEQLRSAGEDLEELAITSEQRSLLRSLITGLPNDLRQTLVLSTVGEMTSADIAKAMGVRESSVRRRLMRARQLLRQKLTAILEANRG